VSRSIYRTAEGREEVLGLYDRAVEELGIRVEERDVETRFGSTHILLAGPESAPPLLVFHGGNAPNPLSLAWFEPLATRWRIHAPDTIGHPGKSADVRISPRDDSYGRWAVDVMDALGLDRVPVVGPSYGAGIILRMAAIVPDRIDRAALLVPAGIVPPNRWSMARELLLPALIYRLVPSRERLDRVLDPLFTEPLPELWFETTRAILRHVRPARMMPRSVTRAELDGYEGPTLVVAAGDDVLFPARDVIPRAEEVIPGRVVTEVLEGCRHVPDRAGLERIRSRARDFLLENA